MILGGFELIGLMADGMTELVGHRHVQEFVEGHTILVQEGPAAKFRAMGLLRPDFELGRTSHKASSGRN